MRNPHIDAARCDVCAKYVNDPLYTKVKEGWFIWFFCSEEHGHFFVHTHNEDQTLHTQH